MKLQSKVDEEIGNGGKIVDGALQGRYVICL
jgi:hypothetical protein